MKKFLYAFFALVVVYIILSFLTLETPSKPLIGCYSERNYKKVKANIVLSKVCLENNGKYKYFPSQNEKYYQTESWRFFSTNYNGNTYWMATLDEFPLFEQSKESVDAVFYTKIFGSIFFVIGDIDSESFYFYEEDL